MAEAKEFFMHITRDKRSIFKQALPLALIIVLASAPLTFLSAAEFEVVDKLSVNGYSLLKGDVQVGDLTASTISASGHYTFAGISQPTAAPGRVYYDSAAKRLRLSTGTLTTDWVDLSTGGASGAWSGFGGGGTQWVKIYNEDVTSAKTSITIPGLSGDSDVAYKVVARIVNAIGTSAYYYIRPNNDTNAANYGYQVLAGQVTTPSAAQETSQNGLRLSGNVSGTRSISEATLLAKSGQAREMILHRGTNISGTTVGADVTESAVWNNTSSNITSLVIASDQTNGIGVGSHIEVWTQGNPSGPVQWITTGNDIYYSAGNVGIGTSGPATTLDVNGSAQFGAGTAKSGFTATGNLQLVSGSTITSNGTLTLSTAATAAAATANLFINANGNVGIGTKTPTTTLDMTKASASAVMLTIRNTDEGTNSWAGLRQGNNVAANRLEMWTIPSTYVDSNLYHADGSVITNEGTGGLAIGAVNAAGILRFASGGYTERMTIIANGNVGVATTAPAYKLDVNGAVNATSVLINGVAVGAGGTQWASGVGGIISYTGGNVGIGTINPGVKLTVAGDAVSDDTVQLALRNAANTMGLYAGYNTTGDYGSLQALEDGVGYKNLIINKDGGSVGIGTASPATPLHVYKDQTTLADNTALVTLESGGTATVNKGRVLDVYTARGDGFTDGYIAQFRNAQNTKLYIRGDGYVGIGTAAPSAMLDVNGSAQFGSGAAKSTFTAAGNLQLVSGSTITSNGTLTLSTAATAGTAAANIFISTRGDVGIGTAAPGVTVMAGRRYLTLAGITDASVFEMISGAANTDGGLIGQIDWVDQNSTRADKRRALMQAVYSGTTANQRGALLGFYTAPDAGGLIERMRITADGNVGIGTGTPETQLQIDATATNGIYVRDSNPASASPLIRVRGQRSDANSSQSFSGGLVLEHYYSGGPVTAGKALGTLYFGGNYDTTPNMAYAASISGVADGAFTSASEAPSALVFKTGATSNALGTANVSFGTERMRITSAGDIGIGTTAPGSRLHIYGSGSSDTPNGDIIMSRNWTSTVNTRASSIFHYYQTGVGDFMALGVSGDWGGAAQNYNTPNQLSLAKMVIGANGNVGIGTASPKTVLHIHSSAANGTDAAFYPITIVANQSCSTSCAGNVPSGLNGASGACLMAWSSGGVPQACSTALANQFCLCVGIP